MSDAVLNVLKFCLLALLYLFLVRVVWIVARELRGTPVAPVAPPAPAPARAPAPASPDPKKRAWKVVVLEPERERGQVFAVDGDATLGRGGGCTIPLTFDTFVSTVHARLSSCDGQLWVEDTGSTNGTFVNGKRVDAPVQLRKGDKVKLGETVLEAQR
jgi:pSer/pThr/pTyr-binding forkhead associated (FHA) protein